MEPRIGIVTCGFTQDRQFVTNPYIQSVRYAKGIPIILPLVRSDHLLDFSSAAAVTSLLSYSGKSRVKETEILTSL